MQRLLRWRRALRCCQTYLFLFHHSPHSPTSRLQARLKLLFVICIWWLRLAKGCHSDCRQSGGEEKKGKIRGRKVPWRQEELQTQKLREELNVRSKKVMRSDSEQSLTSDLDLISDLELAWGVIGQALQRICEKRCLINVLAYVARLATGLHTKSLI